MNITSAYCICVPTMVFYAVAAASGIVLPEVLHKVAHSKNQAPQGDTNGCNLGTSKVISSPPLSNFVSDISRGVHPSDNLSFL